MIKESSLKACEGLVLQARSSKKDIEMSEPTIAATVECRIASSRLPGKVMMESLGKPMLEYLVERLKRVERLDHIVLATTENSSDGCIAELAGKLNVGCFRGSEDDVLHRVLCAAESVNADLIVEITGDCPLIDPGIASQTLSLYLSNECDYASNDLTPSYPLGMDVQVFSTDLLRLADREGQTPDDREHVSWFFIRNPKRFRLLMLPAPPQLHWPDLRLTLDEIGDFRLIDAVISTLYPSNPEFSCYDIVSYLRKHPHLLDLNRMVEQRSPEK